MSRDQLVEPFAVDALVMQSDPYAVGDGLGPDASKPKYSIMVELAQVADRKILPGATIAATGTRPKLMVTSVHSNGPALWMDCVEGVV